MTMRNILVVVGSGIIAGNTDRLSDAFINGAMDAGHTVHKVFLGTEELNGCRGCGACHKDHHCVIDDVMQRVYPLFSQCDTIVMASPLYFWTLSAQIKAYMDRLYAVSTDDIYPPKDTLLLMTAGDDKPNTFDGALSYYKFITNALGWLDVGSYMAGGCTGGPGRHEIADAHLKNAYTVGRQLI